MGVGTFSELLFQWLPIVGAARPLPAADWGALQQHFERFVNNWNTAL